jgi:hypothetical protein
VVSARAHGERVSGRRGGTNILRIFGGLFIYGGLRKKTIEGKAIFGGHKKATEDNMLFSLAIKTPPKHSFYSADENGITFGVAASL